MQDILSVCNFTCSVCSPPCLSQHLIVLHLVTFAPADFALQGVLVEPAADVDQQSGGTGVDGTTEDHVTHALRHVDAEPQDNSHQQAFQGGGAEEGGSKGKAVGSS